MQTTPLNRQIITMLRQMNLLSMANGTVRQLERRFNVILRYESAAQCFLID